MVYVNEGDFKTNCADCSIKFQRRSANPSVDNAVVAVKQVCSDFKLS